VFKGLTVMGGETEGGHAHSVGIIFDASAVRTREATTIGPSRSQTAKFSKKKVRNTAIGGNGRALHTKRRRTGESGCRRREKGGGLRRGLPTDVP